MNGWRVVRFEPLDVVTCADGRSLEDGGYGHAAEISPSTLAGVLRTAVLRRAGFDFRKKTGQQSQQKAREAARWVGTRGEPEKFRFAGPQILGHRPRRLYFPAPRLWCRSGAGAPVRDMLKPEPAHGLMTDPGLEGLGILRAPPGDPRPAPAEGWVSARDLANLLLGEPVPPGQEVVVEPEVGSFADIERRFGHERDSGTGVVAEGQLFSRSLYRFRDDAADGRRAAPAFAGLLTDLPEDALPPGPFFAPLGGDGRRARVTVHDPGTSEELLRPLEGMRECLKKRLKEWRGLILYLACPAIFCGGWKPKTPPGLTLRAAAVGRPRIVAGWDAAKGEPRPVYRAVPAGSAYLYSIESNGDAAVGNLIKDLIEKFHGAGSVCEVYPKTGFGLTFLGAWDARAFQQNHGRQ